MGYMRLIWNITGKILDGTHSLFMTLAKLSVFLLYYLENYDVDPDPTHVIYDFMVLKKFRRNGLGREAAVKSFDLYQANWKVAQMSSNEPAILFWRDVIREYTDNRYTEILRQDLKKYVQVFSTKINEEM